MKPGSPPLQSKRLLDQVRERARYLHYSLSTEKVYLYWARFFIRWHGLRHPRDKGSTEVEAFLTMLATERKVSASTHNQALSALLFLYREVLAMELPWMEGIKRPRFFAPALRTQWLAARAHWESDLHAQRNGVEMPHAPEAKYPKTGQTWAWSTRAAALSADIIYSRSDCNTASSAL